MQWTVPGQCHVVMRVCVAWLVFGVGGDVCVRPG